MQIIAKKIYSHFIKIFDNISLFITDITTFKEQYLKQVATKCDTQKQKGNIKYSPLLSLLYHLNYLLVVGLILIDSKCSVGLFQQDKLHQLMWKGHLRKGQFIFASFI